MRRHEFLPLCLFLFACSSGESAGPDAALSSDASGDTTESEPSIDASVETTTDASASEPSVDAAPVDSSTDGDDGSCPAPTGTLGTTHGEPFSYGRHYPNGAAAVAYAYGPDGMWGHMDPLEYKWNYYSACANGAHPYDPSSLIAYANGTHFTTSGDANCHILCDVNHSGSLPVPDDCGHAFFEHDGKGQGGAASGVPFTQFWSDDNWLARYMSQAYGRTLADGLSEYADFTRWRILGGDGANWAPYGSDTYIDQIALDGLFYLATGRVTGGAPSAVDRWSTLLGVSGSTYDAITQRYLYPSIDQNYHMALFKILTDQLLGESALDAATRATLVQHSESLRSDILDNQQTGGTTPLGWCTGIPAGGSLMNIESLAAGVLALAARANSVLEPGVGPMTSDAGTYFLRPYHVLSAVTGMSQPGYMTRGPGFEAPPGAYVVEFLLRAPMPAGTMATVDVYDAASGSVLAAHDVTAAEMGTGNTWTPITLPATIGSTCNRIEFRTRWTGTSNLDVGAIRVR